MNEDAPTAVVRALVQYLRANPSACDSASGIARWWLQPDHEVSMSVLVSALEWLKRNGVLEDSSGADGRVRYRRSGDDAALDRALASCADSMKAGDR